MDHESLVRALRAIQHEQRWSERRLALELDVDRSFLHHILRGTKNPGRQTLRKIMRRFPELTPQVLAFLQLNVSILNETDEQRPHRDHGSTGSAA